MGDSLRELEFVLMRYVPDPRREEFVNIGLIVLENSTASNAYGEVRFIKDWQRVRDFDPSVDIQLLQALETDLREIIVRAGPQRCLILDALKNRCSNALQLSQPKGCLTHDPVREADILTELYLTPRTS